MKVDGGLSFVTGPMGSGKTLFEVRGGVERMLQGGWWVTNVPLYDVSLRDSGKDFDGGEAALRRICRHVAPASRAKRERLMGVLSDRYRYTDDLYHALHHGVHGSKRKPGVAMARLGWDESYSALNAREWDGGRGSTKDDRAELMDNVPMLRKLGVHGYLLAQHEETVDKNMRRICNYVIRLQNQRENVRFMGMRIKALPSLFVAYYYFANQAVKTGGIAKPVVTERHFLSWHRHLYDTHGLYNSLERGDKAGDVIWLGAPARLLALPETVTQERAGRAALDGAT